MYKRLLTFYVDIGWEGCILFIQLNSLLIRVYTQVEMNMIQTGQVSARWSLQLASPGEGWLWAVAERLGNCLTV